MLRWLLGLLALVLVGCESGLAVVVDISLSDDVASAYSEAHPGLLRVVPGDDLEAQSFAPLCGTALKQPLQFVRDLGLGCLSELKDQPQQVHVRAWIEPLPSAWGKAAFCRLTPSHHALDVRGVAPVGLDGGVSEALAEQPASDWPQGEDDALWKRDASACGGVATGRIQLR